MATAMSFKFFLLLLLLPCISQEIEFGIINQFVSAFTHILGDFSLVIGNSKFLSDTWEDIQRFRSSSALASNESTPPEKYAPLLEIEILILKTRNVLPFLTNMPNSDNMNDKAMKPTTNELIKQSLPFARLLLSKSQLASLDESTCSLDEAIEEPGQKAYTYAKLAQFPKSNALSLIFLDLGDKPIMLYYSSFNFIKHTALDLGHAFFYEDM
ncbi:hypothetical protein VNO77_44438 [Canavalia gladiata]|uniref:Uncharacterized protein n=1 Tax=Canavalia gladiata TaxID=3824 RepID=A0AAN9JY84_CANGL